MRDATRFWAGRRVALTGASGFVGFHLATRLADLGARVTALLRSEAAFTRLMAAGVNCRLATLDDVDELALASDGREFFFHLAGAVDFGEDWSRFEQVNVQGTANVLAAARRVGVRRFVHTSSIVAVGASEMPRALDESATWNLGPYRVPYVTTKRRGEELALAAGGRALEVVVVNPSCVIGPDDHGGSEFGTLCRRFWRGRIPFYFGGGQNYVDVRDVALGHCLAAESGRPGERYLLTGWNCSQGDFFWQLARLARKPMPRVRLPLALARFAAKLAQRRGRSGGRAYLTPSQARLLGLYFFFDSAKARRELGYEPRRPQQTLADTHAFWAKCA